MLLLVATASVRVAILACEIACLTEPSAHPASGTAHIPTTACHGLAQPAGTEGARLSAAAPIGDCDHEVTAPTVLTSKAHSIAAGAAIAPSGVVPAPVTPAHRGAFDHAPPGPALTPIVPLRI